MDLERIKVQSRIMLHFSIDLERRLLGTYANSVHQSNYFKVITFLDCIQFTVS